MAEQTIFSFSDEIMEINCVNCAVCSNILQPPIVLVESIGNVCGSCFDNNYTGQNLAHIQNFALEKIMRLLKLPCEFKSRGCDERLFYQDIQEHKKRCKFRIQVCAMHDLYHCTWEGNSQELIVHFKESHGDHVINFENNLFFLEIPLKDLNIIKLLVTNHHAFILQMLTDSDKNKLYYVVCNVSDSQNQFNYSVKHKGSSNNYIKTKSKVQSSHVFYSDFNEETFVSVDLGALKQISHTSETITNVFKIKINDTQVEGIDEKMLHFFECPVCKNFMKPPIYQCQSGHSICNLCRPRVEKCPTCRAAFANIRNYSLEGLTSGVQYPCAYHDLGCTEIAPSTQIVNHEKECSFKPYSCPFSNCLSNGNHLSIISHLINVHSDSVLYSGPTGYTDSIRIDPSLCYSKICDRRCVIAYNHIFRLSYKRVPEHWLWAAEVFGCSSESKTFVYEVAIIDMRRPEKKLIRTDYCLSGVSEDELFKRCIMFPNSILSSYSNHGMITFHFSVKEK